MIRKLGLLVVLALTAPAGLVVWLATSFPASEVERDGEPPASAEEGRAGGAIESGSGAPSPVQRIGEPVLDPPPDREAAAPPQTTLSPRVAFEIHGRITALDGEAIRTDERELNDAPLESEWSGRAKLEVRARRGEETLRTRTADDDGRFVLPKLAKGSWRVVAAARGYEAKEARVELDDARPSAELDFVLAPLERVRVEVVVTNAQRVAFQPRPFLDNPLADRLFVDARIVFSRAQPDRGEPPWFSDPSVVAREIRMEHHEVRGNDWVFPARCFATRAELANGFFIGLHVGTTSVEAHRAELPLRTVVIPMGARMYADEFATLALHLVDGETHAPIVDARVELLRPGFPAGRIGSSAGLIAESSAPPGAKRVAPPEARKEAEFDRGATDASGALRLELVRPGRALLVIEEHGHERVERELLLQAGKLEDLGPLTLGQELVARGRVVDAEGQPALCAIELVPLGDGLALRDTLGDAEGRFEVHGLARRVYFARAAGQTRRVVEPAEVDLTRGSVEDIELRLRAGNRVAVELRSPSRGEVEVQALDARDRPLARVHARRSGRCDLYLLPGDYVIVVDEKGRRLSEHTLRVGTEERSVQFELP